MTLKNNRASLLYYAKLSTSFQSDWWIQTWVTVRKCSIWVKISNFFVQCDLEIRRMVLKNNRAPLLCCFKLCASFDSHQWIQSGVTVRNRSIRVKIGNFLSRVTQKFDGWPWKTIGHLFYNTSRFVHHFKAIGELKFELSSGNAQFGSKSAIFCPVWPRNLMDDLENQKGTSPKQHQPMCIISSYVNSNWSYSLQMAKLGFDLCDLDLWPLTLTFCMDIPFVNGNNSWKFHDDTMMGT